MNVEEESLKFLANQILQKDNITTWLIRIQECKADLLFKKNQSM